MEHLNQIPLWPRSNPLSKKYNSKAFNKIPKTPGVYWMLSRENEILYVGKSKCLRQRLQFYRQNSNQIHSKKITQLLRRVSQIQWLVCQDEKQALILENQLLRKLKPKYNLLNTKPETYFYFGLLIGERQISFRVSPKIEDLFGLNIYGPFKSRGLTMQTSSALGRLSYLACHSRWNFPRPLTKPYGAKPITISFDPAQSKRIVESLNHEIHRFFSGISIEGLMSFYPICEHSPFLVSLIYSDQKRIQKFYRHGPIPNLLLKQKFKIQSHLLEPHWIDDLPIL